jgi:hypothetical protein
MILDSEVDMMMMMMIMTDQLDGETQEEALECFMLVPFCCPEGLENLS